MQFEGEQPSDTSEDISISTGENQISSNSLTTAAVSETPPPTTTFCAMCNPPYQQVQTSTKDKCKSRICSTACTLGS